MKENQLISLLILIGVLSISVIVITSYYSKKSLSTVVPEVLTTIFCWQDENKTFIIGEPQTIEKCQYIEKLSGISKEDLCLYYNDNKKEICKELKKIIDGKSENCLKIILGKEINQTNDNDKIEISCRLLKSR